MSRGGCDGGGRCDSESSVSAAFVVAVGLIMTSAFLVSVVRRDLVRSVETALVREADEIETLLDDEAAVVIMLAARTEDNFLAQLQRGDERIASTANLGRPSSLGHFGLAKRGWRSRPSHR